MNVNTSVHTFLQYSLLYCLIITGIVACNFSSESAEVVSINKASIEKESDEPNLGEFKKVNTQAQQNEAKTLNKPKKDKTPISKQSNEPKPTSSTTKKAVTKKAAVKKSIAPKPKIKKPKILFEEPTYDFGEIIEGDIIKHKFKFKNTGNSELVIKSAYASCGCTDPSYPFMGIPPGEEGFIGLTYNSVSKDGAQKPEVTIKTNIDDTAYVLYLEGIVKPKKKEESPEKRDSSKLEKTDSLKLEKN